MHWTISKKIMDQINRVLGAIDAHEARRTKAALFLPGEIAARLAERARRFSL